MKKLIPLLLLGMAFGVIEGSVVIYLRPFFNAEKSDFSLQVIQSEDLSESQHLVLGTEIMREAATLVLIAGAAAAAAASLMHWAAYFVFIFAVWDIFYYIFLFYRIGWPSSLMDWDILFLIPQMWFAPVIVPLIISLIGIVLSVLVVKTLQTCGRVRLSLQHWVPVCLALLLWQISFLNHSSGGMTEFPVSYSWWLFIPGVMLVLASGVLFYRDFYHKKRHRMFRV